MTLEELEDILEKHYFYDRKTMRHYENGSLKLIICPILDTGYSDIFVLTNDHNAKWKEEKTIKQMLITNKENSNEFYRIFILSTINTQFDDINGKTMNLFSISKINQTEKHILEVLDATNLWEEP